MTAEKRLLTAEELFCLPAEYGSFELLDGELVELTPPGGEHGLAQLQIGYLLKMHVLPAGLGTVIGETGIVLARNPDRVRAPDLCFYAVGRLPGDRPPRTYLDIMPDLVVEIVSPTDRAGEIQQKTDEWLAAGVRLVWTAYPDTRSIVAATNSEVRVYRAADTLSGAPVLPEFYVMVADLFT